MSMWFFEPWEQLSPATTWDPGLTHGVQVAAAEAEAG